MGDLHRDRSAAATDVDAFRADGAVVLRGFPSPAERDLLAAVPDLRRSS